MGMSAVQYKIMPDGVDSDFDAIKTAVEAKIVELGGMMSSVEEQPIAFGLKALIFSFAYPEENEIDVVGNALSLIAEISSAEMIDYRRALG